MSDHTPTLADLCCAIAEGRIPASSDGVVYQVTALEVRRHLIRKHTPSLLSFLSSLSLRQDDEPHKSIPVELLPQSNYCGLGL